ncbi:MAG: imelysin family protein [Saprospiraceae bacterium]
MKNTKSFFYLLLAVSTLIVSCGADDEKGSAACNSDFDQQALFVNVADNFIVPGYEIMLGKLDDLQSKTTAFTSAPDQATLKELRDAYLSAYVEFQKIAPYEFGPAESVFLRMSLNNFPTNSSEIENRIEANNTDFSQPESYNKGFPALDYLLYGVAENDESIVDKLGNQENYKNYLVAVVTDMKERVDQTLAEWKGGYRESFVENTGTAAGTSLSLIVNGLNENFELIKREKIGIPSGVLTLDFVNPTKVEAYYSGNSVLLARTALEATKNLYKGSDGIGLDDYLQDVRAMKGDGTLDEAIQVQFATMITAVSELNDPLSEAIDTDPDPVVAAYNEISKQVVNLKTDLPSVLCVSITYIDNPSDSD